MNFHRLKHAILRLSAEEKVMGLGSIAMIIGGFLPWHQITMSFDGEVIQQTGLSGDLGVIGFVILLMGLMSMLVLVAENLHLPLPKLGYKREQILFFLLGESAFLTLLTIAIYTKRSIEFTDAGLRFGIYIVLAGAFFGALSAFSLLQKIHRKDTLEFFNYEEEEDEADERKEASSEESITTPFPEESMAFEEDAQLEAEFENKLNEVESSPRYIAEDDPIEEIQEVPKGPNNQANYFVREAGISKEKEEKKPGNSSSMGFYEDQ